MPRLCAFGCQPSGSRHRFPNHGKFPERFKEWVSLCGGKLDTVSDYEHYSKQVMCDKHFTENDHNRNNRLNALAVPSLYMSGTGEMSSSSADDNLNESPNNYLPQSDPVIPKMAVIVNAASELPNVSYNTKGENLKEITKSNKIFQEHNYTAASKDRQAASKKSISGFNCVQLNNMRSQIKRLRTEVCRLKKTRSFQTRYSNAQKIAFNEIVQRLPKPSQLFLNMQLQHTKKPKERRFNMQEKILSVSLYKKSPKCYALLSKYFTLPSVKAMKRCLSKINISDGINPIIFKK